MAQGNQTRSAPSHVNCTYDSTNCAYDCNLVPTLSEFKSGLDEKRGVEKEADVL
jgi:hypothetical protein